MRRINGDLDQVVDEQGWVKEHPVYCPVPWCSAHKLRFARCGDEDGPYVGIHTARIAYVPKFAAIEQRLVRFYAEIGVDNPAGAASLARILQDMIDSGVMPGRRGRRRV